MTRPGFVEKIEYANENKAKTLRQKIERDVDNDKMDKLQPFSLQTFAAFQSCLINLHDYPDDFRNYFEESFLDMDLLQDLERAKVINWCQTAKRLYPLKTTGDSSCLLHAVSLALLAIEDTLQILGRLLYLTLSTDPTGAFKHRWLCHHRSNQGEGANYQLNTSEFAVKWESIVKAAADIEQQQGKILPYATLESFHLFVLANVLHRPIIVLANKRTQNIYGQSLQESNIGGIYLPLEMVPTECIKTPVIIGYNMNHFAPLVMQEGDSSLRMDVVSIVTHELEMMVVHYLFSGEEPEVVRLLENYLQMTETALTETDSIMPILSVRLEKRKLPEDLNLMEDLRQDCETKFCQWIDQEYGSENPVLQIRSAPVVTPKQNIVAPERMPELQDNNRASSLAKIMRPVPLRQTQLPPQVDKPVVGHSNRQKCLTTGCMMYGSPEMYNLCSKCFRDYTVTYHNNKQAIKLGQPAQTVQGQNFITKLTGSASGIEPTFEGLRLESNQSRIHEPVQFVLPSTASVETSPRLVTPAIGQVAPPISPNIRRCKAKGCDNHAMPANNGLCEACYYKYMFGEGNIPEKENWQLSPNAEALNRLSGPANKCSSPRCENIPPAGKTICHECFKSPGLEGLNISANQIINLSQYPAPAMIPKSWSFEPPPTDQQITAMTEVRSKSSDSYHCTNVEKYLCATPGCHGIMQNNNLDACLKCYMRATTKEVSRNDLDTAENANPSLNSSVVLCCTGVYWTNDKEKRLNPIVTEQMVSCAGKACGKFICPPKKLCDECQEILEQAHANKSKQVFRHGRQNVTAPIRSNPAPQQLRPHTAPVVAKGIVLNCDRYGYPATGSMCEYTQRTITTTGQQNVPAVVRQNVPYVGKQAIHPVNQRLSNPNSQGTYSTSTFSTLQPFPHRSESQEGNFTASLANLEWSQKKKFKCIKGCFNFGSFQNQGMCNECFMRYLAK